MSHYISRHCTWRTTTYGDNVSISKRDIQTLGEHFDACRQSPSHLFALRCVAESTHGFVASRFITTLAILVLVFAAGYWAM